MYFAHALVAPEAIRTEVVPDIAPHASPQRDLAPPPPSSNSIPAVLPELRVYLGDKPPPKSSLRREKAFYGEENLPTTLEVIEWKRPTQAEVKVARKRAVKRYYAQFEKQYQPLVPGRHKIARFCEDSDSVFVEERDTEEHGLRGILRAPQEFKHKAPVKVQSEVDQAQLAISRNQYREFKFVDGRPHWMTVDRWIKPEVNKPRSVVCLGCERRIVFPRKEKDTRFSKVCCRQRAWVLHKKRCRGIRDVALARERSLWADTITPP